MSTTNKAPKTIEELQSALRLKNRRSAEALIKAFPVTEAFRKYSNRCLSSSSMNRLLPDWKVIDEYIHDKQMLGVVGRAGRTLEQSVERDCVNKPYGLVPHAAMFVLRITKFLKSKDGKVYDIPLQAHAVKFSQDPQFDRCVRIMNLLSFLVNQNRGRQANRAIKGDIEKREGNWI